MSTLLPCIASCSIEERGHLKNSNSMMNQIAGRFKLRSIGKQISHYQRESFREVIGEEWDELSHLQLTKNKLKRNEFSSQEQNILDRAKKINNKHYPKGIMKRQDYEKGNLTKKRPFGSSDSLFCFKQSHKQNIDCFWRQGKDSKIKEEGMVNRSKGTSKGGQLMRVSNNRFFRSKWFRHLQEKE